MTQLADGPYGAGVHPGLPGQERPVGGAEAEPGPFGQAGPAGGVDAYPGPFGMLIDLVRDGGVVLLTGAGLSTESGIPDYRGPTGQARRAEPMTYQTFVGGAAARQRYWARSHVGWRHVARAAPNAGHRAVAELERLGLVTGMITQNVDGLHQAAGARQLIELHGSLDRVLCLTCGQRSGRGELDERLRAANPGWLRYAGFPVRPARPRGQRGHAAVRRGEGDRGPGSGHRSRWRDGLPVRPLVGVRPGDRYGSARRGNRRAEDR